jgi:CO/xanthine dehydrogenase FAD-binding subunit
LPALEAALAGHKLDAGLADIPGQQHLAPLNPIDDIRGTAPYRLDAALTLLRRSLRELGGAAA